MPGIPLPRRGLAALGASLALPAIARAQAGYPNRTITLIVPYPPGGSTDLLARRIGAARAEAMLLSGATYTAEEMHELGVVQVLAEPGQGAAAVRQYIDRQGRRHSGHRAIYRAAGNPHLEDTLVRYNNLATRIFCLFLDRITHFDRHIGEHIGLLRAIAKGESTEAERIARDHVTGFEAAIRAIV